MTKNIDKAGDFALKIENQWDFMEFLKLLIEDYENFPDDWENSNLEDYLQGLQRFFHDVDGNIKFFNRKDIDAKTPSWRLFAHLLLGARVYD